MEKMDGQVRGTCSAGAQLTQGPPTCCVPRPGFSKNSPVWLLGWAYHRKLVEGPGGGEGGGSPVGGQVTTFTETDSGIEAFEKDYRSKVRRVSSQLVSLCQVWMSYRRGFEEIPGTRVTSDCGWGCMLRWEGITHNLTW